VNTAVVDKRYFQGLPSPAAAALVTGFIWLMNEYGIRSYDVAWVMFGLALYAGLTMVTNVPFYSFKDIQRKRTVPFVVIVLIVLAIAVINLYPPAVLFAMFVVYGLSGYAMYFWRRARGERASVIATSTDEPEESGLHR
jgi:CDP-diacylglycerol---serine O-phosphatidyltransferase